MCCFYTFTHNFWHHREGLYVRKWMSESLGVNAMLYWACSSRIHTQSESKEVKFLSFFHTMLTIFFYSLWELLISTNKQILDSQSVALSTIFSVLFTLYLVSACSRCHHSPKPDQTFSVVSVCVTYSMWKMSRNISKVYHFVHYFNHSDRFCSSSWS